MKEKKIIRNILIISLTVAVLFPLINIYYIYPSFTSLLVENIESDAIRTATHLKSLLIPEGSDLSKDTLKSNAFEEIDRLKRDFDFTKLRVFSKSGEVLYSTEPNEIGNVNNSSYFHEIVAKGNKHSNVVTKDNKSLEDQIVTTDVVETYVPIMTDNAFRGAFEIYHDISIENHKLNNRVFQSVVIPLALMFIFLVAVVVTLVRVDKNIDTTLQHVNLPTRYQTPYYPLLFLSASIFISEIVVMSFLNHLPPIAPLLEPLFDAMLLVMLNSPMLYFFLVRPLMVHVHERKKAEEKLDKHYKQLEVIVDERTIELKREVEERKRAEEELRESEERYRMLVENVDLGITLIDRNYNVVMVNRFQGNMFNTSAIEFIGKHCFKEFEKREAVCTHCPGTRAMATGKPAEVDTAGVLDDGSKIFVHIKAFPVFAPDGQAMGFVEVVEDVTEKKKMKDELLKVQKLESIGLLAGGIAHDFNNLLTGILGNISLAKTLADSEDKVFDRLVQAEKASKQAQDLTQQLLTFSKGGTPIKKTASILELLKNAINITLSGSNVKYKCLCSKGLWLVEVDKSQLIQVIQNIIINATQAMPNGGTINVKCLNIMLEQQKLLPLKEGKYVRVSIEDHGIGIPEENIQKIYEPYFTTKEKGNGLGLATAFSIIKKHDGYLTVSSEQGKGTTFYVYLPASEKAVKEKEWAVKETGAGEGRVLVMDDEVNIREFAGEALKHLGYKTDFANDGKEAIDLYSKAKEADYPFDAVIMDLTIPGGMGGKETIKELRKIDPGVKAIVSSGYSNDPIMSEFKDYGFSGVITKPYTINDLSRVVDEIINDRG